LRKQVACLEKKRSELLVRSDQGANKPMRAARGRRA
jgi:hypothetical protein